MTLALWQLRLHEWFSNDSRLCRLIVGLVGLVAARAMMMLGKTRLGVALLCRLHRGNYLAAANRAAEETVRHAIHGINSRVTQVFRDQVANVASSKGTARFFEDPRRIWGTAALVVKSSHGNEKGVIAVHYNHVFPLLARFFDIERIAQRYHVVLEPSWSGYCDPDILCYCQFRCPVFVQAYEPRDVSFIESINSNLVRIPTASNWWVDHRLFRPLPGVEKDIDIAMVAGWGAYKRHYAFFSALSRLRRQGHRPRVLLVGYAVDWTKETVLNQARYYGVADQLEVVEGVPYEQVNDVINRAKIHVLWSRKEGIPRAIVECMFAGVPSIVREGLNYGYKYPFINEQTGAFSDEESLPRRILELLERSGEMRPRAWVLENMSCQRATEVLSTTLGQWCAAHGEPWTETPVVKVRQLHRMTYWDSADAERFKADYEWLASQCRREEGALA